MNGRLNNYSTGVDINWHCVIFVAALIMLRALSHTE